MAPPSAWKRLPHPVRWFLAATIGAALIIVGVVLLVLPGPGLVLIALGLAVLASEFAWAQAVLHHARRRSSALGSAIAQRRTRRRDRD